MKTNFDLTFYPLTYHFLTITGTFCVNLSCVQYLVFVLSFFWDIECIFVKFCPFFVKVFYLISFHQRIIYIFLWQILSLAFDK